MRTIGPFSVRSAIARGAFALLCATAPVAAQTPSTGKEKPTITPIARFVPAGAKFFVELRRPNEVEEALRDSQVGLLWSMAAGRPANPKQPSELRSALTEFLAPNQAINVDELMKTEMGLMTPTWSDLSSAVWFVRLPKPDLLDRWFPKDRRQETTGATADTLFRMTDGMIVGVRDGIVAMARRGNADLVREVFRLMVGGVAETLHDSPAYRELVGYLPGKTLAVVYWARDAGEPGIASITSPLLPPIDHAVVGISAGEGRIDFAIRAALWAPRSSKTLAGHAVDRLMKLPATTLVACATTIDLNPAAKEAATGTGLLDWWAKASSFVTALRSANGDAAQPLPSFGPHLILAWDQDLTAAGSSPQLALLIETKNTRQLEARFEAIIKPLIVQDAQNGSADDPESEPLITRGTHFGVSIAQASLVPDIEGLPLPLSQWMDELPLSWAAHGDWFIVALGREHIERILDAQFGLVPALSNVRDVQLLRKRRASQTSIVLLQPDLASDVLQRWFAVGPAPPKKLDPSLFSEPSLAEAVQRTRLGIGMQVEPEPGTVVVAKVYPDTAADGHLLPDDRIIGVDGRLLDLETPNADLRRRWAEPTTAKGHTFRVQREDTTIEVFLKHDDSEARPEDLLTRALPAFRGLASALRTIRFASVTVHPTDERHFSALVSLRLAPPPSSASR